MSVPKQKVFSNRLNCS